MNTRYCMSFLKDARNASLECSTCHSTSQGQRTSALNFNFLIIQELRCCITLKIHASVNQFLHYHNKQTTLMFRQGKTKIQDILIGIALHYLKSLNGLSFARDSSILWLCCPLVLQKTEVDHLLQSNSPPCRIGLKLTVTAHDQYRRTRIILFGVILPVLHQINLNPGINGNHIATGPWPYVVDTNLINVTQLSNNFFISCSAPPPSLNIQNNTILLKWYHYSS